jgi:hypothetical protein
MKSASVDRRKGLKMNQSSLNRQIDQAARALRERLRSSARATVVKCLFTLGPFGLPVLLTLAHKLDARDVRDMRLELEEDLQNGAHEHCVPSKTAREMLAELAHTQDNPHP